MNTKRIFLIGFLGNVFEWYDFSIYAYLATTIGYIFFPHSNKKFALLEVFLLFFISYLARPFGSIFFGYLSDKKTRSFSLKLSLFLMGIPSFLIGLLPTYKLCGVYAILLFTILRVIQGFAAGGELPGSACYIYELADKKNRNFFSSFVAASSMLGVLTGSAIVTLMYFVFNHLQMNSWGWRIPFLLGGLILIFLYYIRSQFIDDKKDHPSKFNPLKHLLKNELMSVFKIMMLYAFISVSFYLLFVWMPSYLHVYLHFSQSSALFLSSMGLGMLIIFTLFFGYIASSLGKKNLMLFSVTAIFLCSYPAFKLLESGSLLTIYAVMFFFALFLGCIDGVIMSVMGGLFSKKVRCSGISIAFTFSTALFGGSAPVICTYLINHTGWILSPVVFLMGVCLIGLPAILSLDKNSI